MIDLSAMLAIKKEIDDRLIDHIPLSNNILKDILKNIHKLSNEIYKETKRGGADTIYFKGTLSHKIYLLLKPYLDQMNRWNCISVNKLIFPNIIEVVQYGDNVAMTMSDNKKTLDELDIYSNINSNDSMVSIPEVTMSMVQKTNSDIKKIINVHELDLKSLNL